MSIPDDDFAAKVADVYGDAAAYGLLRNGSYQSGWTDDILTAPKAGVVLDADGEAVAVCRDLAGAEVTCKLVNEALAKYADPPQGDATAAPVVGGYDAMMAMVAECPITQLGALFRAVARRAATEHYSGRGSILLALRDVLKDLGDPD